MKTTAHLMVSADCLDTDSPELLVYADDNKSFVLEVTFSYTAADTPHFDIRRNAEDELIESGWAVTGLWERRSFGYTVSVEK